MPKKQNLKGKKFGRLLVLGEEAVRAGNRSVKWKCQCDCGKLCSPTTSCLNSGHSKSCGCLNQELRKSRRRENHPNWKGGHWNKGSQSYATCLLSSLNGHATKGKYQPPNISSVQLSDMITKHSADCDICGDSSQTLCIDHDHNDGKVRGMLCRKCNHLLGCSEDSKTKLQSAINYLDKASAD